MCEFLTDEGLQWKNMFEPVSPSDKVSVIDLMTMLIVDSVIYMLMAIYIEGVFPGKHGISMPWYFPFQVKNILIFRKTKKISLSIDLVEYFTRVYEIPVYTGMLI